MWALAPAWPGKLLLCQGSRVLPQRQTSSTLKPTFPCSNSTLKQMACADSTGREYGTYIPLPCGFGGSSAAVHLTSQSGNTCNEILSRSLLCPMACRCAMCKSGSEAANLSVVAGDAHSLMYFTCRWLSRSRRTYRHSCCTTMSAWAHTCRWTSRGHLCRRHWRCSSPDPWLRRWVVYTQLCTSDGVFMLPSYYAATTLHNGSSPPSCLTSAPF